MIFSIPLVVGKTVAKVVMVAAAATAGIAAFELSPEVFNSVAVGAGALIDPRDLLLMISARMEVPM